MRNKFSRPVLAVTLAATILLVLSGCKHALMPTPVIYGEGGVDPFKQVHPEDADSIVEVFIATNREPNLDEPDLSPRRYSNNRSERGEVRLAKATIQVGDGTVTWEALHAASLDRNNNKRARLQLTRLEEYGSLFTTVIDPDYQILRSRTPSFEAHLEAQAPERRAGTDAFLADVNAALARSQSKDIYIFVHGFNTKFRDNTFLAAALWHFLGRDGVMISFEWPSRASMFAYAQDKATARASVLAFRLLLLELNKESDAERIHILAHSAGSPIVITALKQIRLMTNQYSPQEVADASKIGQVLLAAPDMDLMRFSNSLYDAFDQIPEHTTIYISTEDTALGFSGAIMGFARLGSPEKAMSPESFERVRGSDSVTVVDVAQATKAYSSFLGHSYFHYNPWVSSDLIMLMRFGATPEQRGLYREPDGAFWLFPTNYEEVAPDHAIELFGEEAMYEPLPVAAGADE